MTDRSLRLDSEDHPHIVYGGGHLYHAWHDGTEWHHETVDKAVGVGAYAALALDGADRPHISYCGGAWNNCTLRHVWHDGVAWQIEVVDAGADVDGYASLALDGAGRPHISYHDYSNAALKYARFPHPHLSLNKQATPAAGLRNNDTLTYTLTVSASGLNVRLWDPLPPLVRYVPGSITGTVAPPPVYSPAAHAVVWQGTPPTGTARMIRFRVTPGITGTGSLDLSGPIVNTAWLTDTESGWSVRATTIVNGLSVYLPVVRR